MSENHHGLLLVDKPSGMTSHDLVNAIRKILNTKSVGHCGTLDPMASGLMVMLIGEATKLSNYILEEDKSYLLQAKLGVTTDTLDTTGTILSESKIDLSPEKIKDMAMMLQGEINLPVPMYSAVKMNGTRLHELARKGEKIETPIRTMKFYDFSDFKQGPAWIELHMHCSKGSFVRAWIHEFGQKLGTGAAMSALVRTGSQPYQLSQAKTLEEIQQLVSSDRLAEVLIPMQVALPQFKIIRLSGLDETLFSNGQISHGLKAQLISIFNPKSDEGVKIVSRSNEKMMGLVGLENGKGFVIRRVFRY